MTTRPHSMDFFSSSLVVILYAGPYYLFYLKDFFSFVQTIMSDVSYLSLHNPLLHSSVF